MKLTCSYQLNVASYNRMKKKYNHLENFPFCQVEKYIIRSSYLVMPWRSTEQVQYWNLQSFYFNTKKESEIKT